MIYFSFYNINIYSSFDIKDQVILLSKELGGNQVLKYCPKYSITILPYQEYSRDTLKNCIRVGYHPLNRREIWKDQYSTRTIEINSDEILIKEEFSYTLFIRDIQNIYSYLRSKICEIIRECKLKLYPFGFHAALIGRDKSLYLIIGAKGSGKTSSVLYAYINGWDVYTDEFVLIDKKSIEVLERFPAINPDVEAAFFADCNLKLHYIIKGYLTGEYKKVIDINLKKCKDLSIENIKKIYILTDYKNNIMRHDFINNIFYKNIILGANISNEQYEIIQNLRYNSKMMNIKEFANEIQEATI